MYCLLYTSLDYYTRTVFEVQVTEGMGSQSAIGGGGRYDKLAESVGGRPTPGLGFALGFERMVLALEAAGALGESTKRVDGYLSLIHISSSSGTSCSSAWRTRRIRASVHPTLWTPLS